MEVIKTKQEQIREVLDYDPYIDESVIETTCMKVGATGKNQRVIVHYLLTRYEMNKLNIALIYKNKNQSINEVVKLSKIYGFIKTDGDSVWLNPKWVKQNLKSKNEL